MLVWISYLLTALFAVVASVSSFSMDHFFRRGMQIFFFLFSLGVLLISCVLLTLFVSPFHIAGLLALYILSAHLAERIFVAYYYK